MSRWRRTLPRTPYRETIRKGAQAHGRHKKQSGGHGQFGDVKLEIRPLARGEGFQFENKVVGGAVPRQFIPAVEAGAREHLQRGPLGFPVVDVAVTLHDGQFHSVDSNELSFKLATAQALKEGLPQCEPVLLEPILKRHHLGAGRLHGQGAAAGLRQARPDPRLRGQARLERLGRDQRPDPARRDARPDRHSALAEPGHRLLRVEPTTTCRRFPTGWRRRSSTSTAISRHSRSRRPGRRSGPSAAGPAGHEPAIGALAAGRPGRADASRRSCFACSSPWRCCRRC